MSAVIQWWFESTHEPFFFLLYFFPLLLLLATSYFQMYVAFYFLYFFCSKIIQACFGSVHCKLVLKRFPYCIFFVFLLQLLVKTCFFQLPFQARRKEGTCHPPILEVGEGGGGQVYLLRIKKEIETTTRKWQFTCSDCTRFPNFIWIWPDIFFNNFSQAHISTIPIQRKIIVKMPQL